MPALFLVLACALWGVSFPVVKALNLEQAGRLGGVPETFLSAWLQMARFGLAALVMAPFLAHKRPRRAEVVQGAWLALWGGLGMGLQAWGLMKETEASTSAFLTQAYCVILPLIACLKTRRAPTPRVIAATLMVVVGGAVLAEIDPKTLKIGEGDLATLAGAFIFTFQILTLENPKYEGNRGLVVTFMMSAWIAVIFLPVSLMLAPQPAMLLSAGASWQAFVLVATLSLVCSVGAYGLMNHWQPKVPSTEAGLIYTTEPIFTAAYAMFLPAWLSTLVGHAYPNESLTQSLIYGGSLILAANVLMQWKHPPHPPAIAPAP